MRVKSAIAAMQAVTLSVALMLILAGCGRKPAPPTVDFSFSPGKPKVSDTIEFTSQAEPADPRGEITKWVWNFGDGHSTEGQTSSHKYSSPGAYIATLTVNDSNGAIASKAHTVVVDTPPTVDFSFTPSSPTTSDSVEFTNLSKDAYGYMRSCRWDYGDGIQEEAEFLSPQFAKTSHRYGEPGVYTVTLTVTDDGGLQAKTVRSIRVIGLTADFSVSGGCGEHDFFDESTASDSQITSWEWDFGDGNTATTRNPSHTYLNPGSYTVRLTVTDDHGNKDSVTHTLKIPPPFELKEVVVGTGRGKDPGTITMWQNTFNRRDKYVLIKLEWVFHCGDKHEISITTLRPDGSSLEREPIVERPAKGQHVTHLRYSFQEDNLADYMGTWHVSIYVDGTLYHTVAFIIEEVPISGPFADQPVIKETVEAELEKFRYHLTGVSEFEQIDVNPDLGTENPNDKLILIYYLLSTAWSERTLLLNASVNAVKIFERLFKNPDVSGVTVFAKAKFLDKYGNEVVETAVKVNMTRGTADKIKNWENFESLVALDYKNLVEVADSIYINPVILRGIKN